MDNEDTVLHKEVEIFNDAILNDSTEVQLSAIKRLPMIAMLIGTERTKEELITSLEQQIDHMEDEILVNLAEQLETFIPYVGGSEYCGLVLNLLIKMSSNDETLVRLRTLEAINSIINGLTGEQVEANLMPLVKSVGVDSWFSEKCFVASLLSMCYPKVDENNKTILRETFNVLYTDSSPLTRKAAVSSLIDLITVLEPQHLKSMVIPVLKNITEDDQDSVRLLVIEVGLKLSQKLNEIEDQEAVFETIHNLSGDASWRVRQRVAMSIHEIQEVFSSPKFRGPILKMFQTLVKDYESEVRVKATENLYEYVKNLRESYKGQPIEENFEAVFEESILPHIQNLTTDEDESVRLVLASHLISLSTILGSDCFKKNILPLVVHALENEESMKYKENLLKNLDRLPEDVDITTSLTSINTVLDNLISTSSYHWRTRRSLIITFVHISKFCSEDFFNSNLLQSYLYLLKDSIYAVRRTATVILPILLKKFGLTWVTNQIIPFLSNTTKDTRYLYRFVVLFCINELIFPTAEKKPVESQSPKYLGIFRDSATNLTTRKSLAKISQLQTRLKGKLDDKFCTSVLVNYEDENNFSNENIKIFAEEVLEALEKQNIEIYNSKTENEQSYLECILILLVRDFLEMVQLLIRDRITNVEAKAKFYLHKIKTFSEQLESELGEEWVQEAIELDDGDLKEILDEVASNLEKKVIDDVEKIDTALMETFISSSNSPLPDLGNNIPELEITNDEVGKETVEET